MAENNTFSFYQMNNALPPVTPPKPQRPLLSIQQDTWAPPRVRGQSTEPAQTTEPARLLFPIEDAEEAEDAEMQIDINVDRLLFPEDDPDDPNNVIMM